MPCHVLVGADNIVKNVLQTPNSGVLLEVEVAGDYILTLPDSSFSFELIGKVYNSRTSQFEYLPAPEPQSEVLEETP